MEEKNLSFSGKDLLFPASEDGCIVSATFLRKGLSDTEIELENLRSFRTLLASSSFGRDLITRYENVSRALLIGKASFALTEDFFEKVFEKTVLISTLFSGNDLEKAVLEAKKCVEWLEYKLEKGL